MNRSERRRIASDTIARSPDIVQEHLSQGATLESSFFAEQLPQLDPSACPHYPPSKIKVVNTDSFTAARDIMQEALYTHGLTTVLNLASDEIPGGGWEHSLSKTQEEALCYSSTLYATLKPSYYPRPNLGPGSVAGVFSPGVVIFKDDLDHGCLDLEYEERRVVSVITVAAPRGPDLTDDETTFSNPSDLEDLRGKIKLVYRMAAQHGQQNLVLGAMGCGAYGCPSQLVAEEMKAALLDIEFKGWFRQVVFAVYSKNGIGYKNFDVFRAAFHDVEI